MGKTGELVNDGWRQGTRSWRQPRIDLLQRHDMNVPPFEGAKPLETRIRRIEKALKMLREGKKQALRQDAPPLPG